MPGKVRVRDARPKYAAVPWPLLSEPGHKPNHVALYAALARVADWHDQRCEASPRELMEFAGFTRLEQLYGSRKWLVAHGFLAIEQTGRRTPPIYTLLAGHPAIANRDSSGLANRGSSGIANRGSSGIANRDSTHIQEGGSPLPPGARTRDDTHAASDSDPGGRGGLAPDDTPWPAVAAALPTRLAERIAARHGHQVFVALAELREQGWTDDELVTELLGEGWPALSSANVPGLALLSRCKTARASKPPHVDAERAAAERAEREAAAAEQAAAEDRARQLREAIESEADELLSAMTDSEVAQLRQDAEAIALEQQLTGPDGKPIRAVVHGLMQAFAWGDANPTPGPLLHARAARRLAQQESTQV